MVMSWGQDERESLSCAVSLQTVSITLYQHTFSFMIYLKLEKMIIYCFTTHNILLFSCEWISTFVSSYHLLQRNKTNSQEDPIKQKHKEVFYFPPILCHNVSELKAYYLGDKLSCISWKLSRQGPPAPVYLDISSDRWRINFSRKISVDRRC